MRITLQRTLALFAILLLSIGLIQAQTVIQVEAGTDVLKPAIDGAAAGDIIELTSSGGAYLSADQIVLDKDLTIRGAAGLAQKPVLKYVGSSSGAYMFKAVTSSRLVFQNLEFDGDGTAEGAAALAKYAFRLDNGDTAGTMIVKVDDCVLHDFNEKIIKPYANCGIDSLIISNSIFYNGAKEGITLYSGSSSDPQVYLDYAEVTNSTFYGFAREAIKGDTNPNTRVRLNHLTIYDCGGSGKGMLYFDDQADVEVKNSLFVKNAYSSYFARFESDASIFKFNAVFDVASWSVSGATTSDTLRVDPQFTDAAGGDFTLMETSPVLAQADDGWAMGDLRWDPTYGGPTVVQVEAGTGTLASAIAAAESGTVLELVTSGGAYLSADQIVLDKDLTIRGAAGLAQKPVLKYVGSSSGAYMFKAVSSPRLVFQNLEFDGDGTAEGAAAKAKYALRLDNGDSSGTMIVKVEDCVLHDFNEKIIKPYANCGIDSLLINNSIFYNGAKEGITLYSGSSSDPQVNLDYAQITNSTFYGFAREAVKGDTNPNTKVRLDHLTVYDCGGTSKGMIYFDDMADVEVTNSIFTKNGYSSYFARFESSASMFKFNDVYDVASWSVSGATVSDTLRMDPQFVDAANADFRLPGNSPLRTAASDGGMLGDPRWSASPDAFFLTLQTEGNGTLTADPAGPYYAPGTTVTLTATPDQDWKISGWEGVLVFPPDSPTATITMDSDKTVKVIFELTLARYALNLSTVGVGHIEFDPAPLDSSKMTYYDGTEVTLTAVSDTSSMAFSAWSGDATGTDNPTKITVTADMNVTATFVPTVTQFTLDVDTIGLGNVMYIPMPYADYGTYDSASVVTLVAMPLPGYEFTGWSGDLSGSDDSLVVVMDSSVAVTATFSEVTVAGGVLAIDTTWDFQEAVEFARNNSQVNTIELTTSGGVWSTDSYISVDFPLTIRAKAGLTERPKIAGPADPNYSSGVFQIKVGGTSLTLDGIEVYNTKYAIRTDDDEVTTEIRINNCYIHDSGEVWVKAYVKSMVDSLIITNSIFRNCKKEGIYLKEANTIKYARLENSTFIHSGREALRVRDNNDMVVIVNHCNFDSTDWESDYRVLYPEGVLNASIKNCIITNQLFTTARHADFARVYGTSEVSNIVVFNASNHVDPEDEAVVDTTTIWEFDPMFEDPANGNYTLTAASHAYGLADDGQAAGDLRWATNTPEHKMLTITIEGQGTVLRDPMPVGLTYDPGQTVTVTAVADSGYEFLSWGGALSGNNNPETVTMDDDLSISATFKLVDAIEDLNGLPKEYALYQNYPNPFNPETTIRFDLKDAGVTTVKVFDVLGREIATLLNKKMQPGKYKVVFYQPQLSTGVYFYQIKSGKFSAIKKMLLVK